MVFFDGEKQAADKFSSPKQKGPRPSQRACSADQDCRTQATGNPGGEREEVLALRARPDA